MCFNIISGGSWRWLNFPSINTLTIWGDYIAGEHCIPIWLSHQLLELILDSMYRVVLFLIVGMGVFVRLVKINLHFRLKISELFLGDYRSLFIFFLFKKVQQTPPTSRPTFKHPHLHFPCVFALRLWRLVIYSFFKVKEVAPVLCRFCAPIF